MHVHIYTYIHIYMYTYIHIYTYTHMHIHTYTHIPTNIYIYIQIYIHITQINLATSCCSLFGAIERGAHNAAPRSSCNTVSTSPPL